MGQILDKEPSELEVGNEEGFDFVNTFIFSKPLLESKDMGMVELLGLKDSIDALI